MATIEALNWPCSSIFQVELVFGCFVNKTFPDTSRRPKTSKNHHGAWERALHQSFWLEWRKGTPARGAYPGMGKARDGRLEYVTHKHRHRRTHTHSYYLALHRLLKEFSTHISKYTHTHTYIYIHTYWLSKAIYSYLRLSTFYLYIYLIHLSNQSHLIPSI